MLDLIVGLVLLGLAAFLLYVYEDTKYIHPGWASAGWFSLGLLAAVAAGFFSCVGLVEVLSWTIN